MKRRLRAPSPALVISLIALFVALGGTTYAATRLPANSVGTKQLRKGAVTPPKVALKTIALFKGQTGPPGPKGDPGPKGNPGSVGPSHGYSTGFTDSNPVTLTSAGENNTLMTLNVPSGHYVVIARLQGITGKDGGGNDFRYDCVLSGPAGTIDSPIYRVGETNAAENYLTYEGGYSGAGPITLVCRSANVHTLTALSGSMVAILVGALN